MQPGVGAWVRVREGNVVKRDDGDVEGDSFVPVPTAAILKQQSALDRFCQVSALSLDQQAAIIVHEGNALALDNLMDSELVMRARRDLRACMIPSPDVADSRSRLLPLTEQHVAEIFGDWALAPATLASWNESVASMLALCPGAWADDRGMASVAVLSAKQREVLVEKGLLRKEMFDPPDTELKESSGEGAPSLSYLIKTAGTVVIVAFFISQTLPALKERFGSDTPE